MDFSLFTEAARDHDAEASQRRTALVRTAVQQEVMPFLALAASDGEYAHRKALIYQRLAAIANRCEASLDETEDVADRMYGLLVQGRQRAAQAAVTHTAAMACSNCNHQSVDHSEGLQCAACGCNNFTPTSRTASTGKEARQVTAEGDQGPFS